MNADILIVEDERKLATLLSDYFVAEGCQCRVLDRGDKVAAALRERMPDLMLLDLQLPGRNGMDVCRDVRAQYDLPIIMVTARVDEIDRLLGLELGADDYICKPFSPREVVARARAVLRRSQRDGSVSSLCIGRLSLDRAARTVHVDAQNVVLTPLEFDIIALLLERPREIVSRQRLLVHAKGTDYEAYERNIDTHMKNLRRKLRALLDDQDPFRTVYGIGYGLNLAAFEAVA